MSNFGSFRFPKTIFFIFYFIKSNWVNLTWTPKSNSKNIKYNSLVDLILKIWRKFYQI